MKLNGEESSIPPQFHEAKVNFDPNVRGNDKTKVRWLDDSSIQRICNKNWQRNIFSPFVRNWLAVEKRNIRFSIGKIWIKSCVHRKNSNRSRLHRIFPRIRKEKSKKGESRRFLSIRLSPRRDVSTSTWIPGWSPDHKRSTLIIGED